VPGASQALYRLRIYEAVTVGSRLLVMKGVLCFNNGQHRASNSSGKVKTRNIYFAPTVSNRQSARYADVRVH